VRRIVLFSSNSPRRDFEEKLGMRKDWLYMGSLEPEIEDCRLSFCGKILGLYTGKDGRA
jgi:hypothetical protein